MGNEPELSALSGLVEILRAEGIQFQIVGMTAALLQGVPGSTLDVDIWINLPARQYIRVLNLCRRLGAEIRANTVVTMPGDVQVNFLYEVGGLRSFATELRRAIYLSWHGQTVPVLPLERVIHSKEYVGRDKDLLQLPALKRTLALKRKHNV